MGREQSAATAVLMFRRSMALILCLVVLIACSRGSTARVAETDQVEMGKSVEVQNWQFELIAPSEMAKIIGEGNITYQANGTFLIVYLHMKNQSEEMKVLPRDLLMVRDSQGRETSAAKSAVQVAFVLQRGMELSLDSPIAAGEERESVLIFDVATDAEGLELIFQDSPETLSLGF